MTEDNNKKNDIVNIFKETPENTVKSGSGPVSELREPKPDTERQERGANVTTEPTEPPQPDRTAEQTDQAEKK